MSKPLSCSSCPLYSIGEGFVSCTMPSKFEGIRLLVQGEAPGRDEADQGKAFVGKAGHWIRNNILYNAGIHESQVIFDNTLRCLPPLNKQGDHYPIGDTRVSAELHCRKYDVWDQCPINLPLLLVGGKALSQRLGLDGISSYHGHICIEHGRVVGTTFHPSAVMRNPKLLPVAIREVQNLMVAATNPSVLDRPHVSKGYVLPYRDTKDIVVDLEWNGDHITVVGIAYDANQAHSTFNVADGLDVVRTHIEAGHRLVGHNIIDADIPKLDRAPKSYHPDHVFDTMVVGHLIHAHLAELGLLGLGDLVRFYFPTTDWKQDKDDLLRYNGYDCAYNYKLYEQLKRDLDATEQWHLVEKQQRLAYMTRLMHERGINVDADGIRREQVEWKLKRAEIAQSFPFNPNSPKQVKEWAKSEGFTLSSTDYETVSKIARDTGHDVFQRLTEYKDEGKSLKVWFPVVEDKKTKEIVSVGNCMFPYHNVTGTDVARFSSSNPNCQNIPPYLRHLIVVPDDSFEIVAFDGSQIENRCLAWEAGAVKMLEAFQSGKDFHRLNAANIFNKRPEDVTKDERQIGKTVTHATGYKETPFNLARRLFGNNRKKSIDRAKKLQDDFFGPYPEIRQLHRRLEEQFNRGEVMVRNPFGRVRFVYERTPHEFAKRATHFLGCSTAADIINQRALDIWDATGYLPILIVHDELAYYLPKGSEGERLKHVMKEIMEVPIKEMPMPKGLGGEFFIPAAMKVGMNYGPYKEGKNEGGLREF